MTRSLTDFPIKDFPTGDLKYTKFFPTSASSLPTILKDIFLFFSKSFTETVEPKIILPAFSIFVTSITFALAIISFISRTLLSI